MRSKGGFSK